MSKMTAFVLAATIVLLVIGALVAASAQAKIKRDRHQRCWLYTAAPRELGWYR